jgi:hypothetical protein
MPNALQGTYAMPSGVARSSAACLRRRGLDIHATEQSNPWPFLSGGRPLWGGYLSIYEYFLLNIEY